MASHIHTQNLKLPLYEANDTPSWLQDWNETMQKLDYYCSTLNSRLYDYVNTLDSINNKLTEDRKILEEALALSKEAKDITNTFSQTMTNIINQLGNLENKVESNYNEVTNEITKFEGNFVPITQAEYDAMGSGRPERVYLIVG